MRINVVISSRSFWCPNLRKINAGTFSPSLPLFYFSFPSLHFLSLSFPTSPLPYLTSRPLPSLNPFTSPLSSLSFPSFPLYHSPPLPSPTLPLKVGYLSQTRESEEHCNLSQRGLGQCPSWNRYWRILAFTSGNVFNDFSENQLPKFHPLPNRLGGLGSVVALSYELWTTNSLYSLQPAVMLNCFCVCNVDHVGQLA